MDKQKDDCYVQKYYAALIQSMFEKSLDTGYIFHQKHHQHGLVYGANSIHDELKIFANIAYKIILHGILMAGHVVDVHGPVNLTLCSMFDCILDK